MPTTDSQYQSPGTLVTGRFYSDGRYGLGEVVARGRPLWTRTGAGYVPVRVIRGDRASGGYRPEDLVEVRAHAR